jgi:hypothetical protein
MDGWTRFSKVFKLEPVSFYEVFLLWRELRLMLNTLELINDDEGDEMVETAGYLLEKSGVPYAEWIRKERMRIIEDGQEEINEHLIVRIMYVLLCYTAEYVE